MIRNRKYLVAVALLAVLAVVFGLAGTVAPPIADDSVGKPQQKVPAESSSSSGSAAHFQNPPTYDSGWVNITDKCGQYITLAHNLNTMDVTVDITGRTKMLTDENWQHFWSMGDVNRDGYIDDADGDLIMAAIFSTPGDPNWNADADLNQDLVVDIYDLVIYSFNYGRDIWTYFGAETHQRNFGGSALILGWSTRPLGTPHDPAEVYSLVPSDGGYALAGPWFTGGFLLTTDHTGGMQWYTSFGWRAYSVIETTNVTGFALVGYGEGKAYLSRYTLGGTELWTRTYGGSSTDVAYSLVQTVDGGYAIAGYSYSYGVSCDVWFFKTNATGDIDWSRTYGGSGSDEARSVIRTNDGGYAIVGNTYSYGAGQQDVYLIKTDDYGNLQWNRTYGGPNYEGVTFSSVVQTSDGGYALAGYTNSSGAGGYDFWLVKTDSTGNPQWNCTYGGTSDDFASSLVQTSDGGYALVGTTSSYGAGLDDYFLVKTDSHGKVQYTRTYGTRDYEQASSIIQTRDGGYVLGGTSGVALHPTGVAGPWLVKTDVETGLARTSLTTSNITLYRGKTDPYWNFIRIRLWTIEEPTWQYGDINQDGIVDAQDLYILSRNYGKTFSIASLGGIAAVAGVYTHRKRKQQNT